MLDPGHSILAAKILSVLSLSPFKTLSHPSHLLFLFPHLILGF